MEFFIYSGVLIERCRYALFAAFAAFFPVLLGRGGKKKAVLGCR
jgi:hypothetical protein